MQDLLRSVYFFHGIFYIDTSLKDCQNNIKTMFNTRNFNDSIRPEREKKTFFFSAFEEKEIYFIQFFAVPPPPAGKHGDAPDRFDHGPPQGAAGDPR